MRRRDNTSQVVRRPTAAFVLSLIGGILDLLVSIGFLAYGASLSSEIGNFWAGFGFFGLIWGVLVVIGAALLYVQPQRHTIWGVVVLIFSILSFFGSIGGLIIGFILGLIGSILGMTWKPSMPAGITVAQMPIGNSPARICPNCGRSIGFEVKYCPHCGKELP